jgi:endonuclease-3
LAAAYGSPGHDNKSDPLDELVFILLSQMTTHHSFGRVFHRLKLRYPNWDDVACLSVNRLKSIIKDAGLSNQKAPRLKAILIRLTQDFGRATLDPLRKWSSRRAESYLTALPGVGTKTAKCVLMYSLGRRVLPVDTHVWRVARRLGLVAESIPSSGVHQALEAVVAPEDRYTFHVNAIAHGRAICLPNRPRCEDCRLRRICRFAVSS